MTPEVRREDGLNAGRYLAWCDDFPGAEARMTYTKLGDGLLVIDELDVPAPMRSRGVGGAMLEACVRDMRAVGGGVVARCPFVKAQFEKTPAWADVWRR